MATMERYRQLVGRLEAQAQRAPGTYKFKLGLLAALGFAVLGGSVLLALGLSVGLVAALVAISPLLLLKLIKVVWIPVAFGGFMLKALWVKFEPPAGHALQPGEAPALEAEIERLRREAGAPPLRAILLDSSLNAGAASVPRALGLLGHEHYLVLGLPLMRLLDRDQLAAVIAHEFGHFGGGHSRFSGWIYRVRAGWYRVLHGLAERRSWTTAAFVRFFGWYAPYFDAYSFVLARAQEYDADATAARVVGAAPLAQALQRLGLSDARLERDFWPAVQGRVPAQPEPPALLFRDMAADLAQPDPQAPARLQELLGRAPDLDDTHPTLSQRLQALAQTPAPPPAPAADAAQVLLGPLADALERQFSREWQEQAGPQWRESHLRHADDQARLSELDARADALSGEERAEYASLVEQLRPDSDVGPLYRAALQALPEHALSHGRYGAWLLARNDVAGVDHVERAIALDPRLLESGLSVLERHYREIGDRAGHQAVWRRIEALQRQRALALQAREQIGAKDEFLPHALAPQALAVAVTGLQRAGNVARAWIARKAIPGDDSGVPHYVVLVKTRGWRWSQSGALQKVVDAIELPGSCIVLDAGAERAVAKRIQALGGPDYVRG